MQVCLPVGVRKQAVMFLKALSCHAKQISSVITMIEQKYFYTVMQFALGYTFYVTY